MPEIAPRTEDTSAQSTWFFVKKYFFDLAGSHAAFASIPPIALGAFFLVVLVFGAINYFYEWEDDFFYGSFLLSLNTFLALSGLFIVAVLLTLCARWMYLSFSRAQRSRTSIVLDLSFEDYAQDILHWKRARSADHADSLFRVAFADLLKDYAESDERLPEALSALETLRSRRQWDQLETDGRFFYNKKHKRWGLRNYYMNQELKSKAHHLLCVRTFDHVDPSASAHCRAVENPEERAALTELMQTVNDSDHYGLEDFLTVATAPLGNFSAYRIGLNDKLLDHINKTVSHSTYPTPGESKKISEIRISFWRSAAEKIRETDSEGFGVDAEIIASMVESEIEHQTQEVNA